MHPNSNRYVTASPIAQHKQDSNKLHYLGAHPMPPLAEHHTVVRQKKGKHQLRFYVSWLSCMHCHLQ